MDFVQSFIQWAGASVAFMFVVLVPWLYGLKKGYGKGLAVTLVCLSMLAYVVYQKAVEINYSDFNHWLFSVIFAAILEAIVAWLIVLILPRRI